MSPLRLRCCVPSSHEFSLPEPCAMGPTLEIFISKVYYTSGAHAIHGFAMGPPRKKALRTRRGLSRNERFS